MFEVDNQFAKASIPRTIRFTEKIFEDLRMAAEENDVSFNMMVLQCCRYALDQLKHGEMKSGET